MKFTNRSQSGFTLVEIAIVLVIIGLLLGGVLKGQQMIENGRIKSIITSFNGVSSAYNSYMDRYQALPGDETLATITARGWGPAPGLGVTLVGNADGNFEETQADTFLNVGVAGTTEQGAMWQALRASGLLAGDPTAVATAAFPVTSTGGFIGVTMNAYAMPNKSICASALTTNQAAGVDVAIDGNTGAAANPNQIGSARADESAVVPFAPTAVVPVVAASYNLTTQVTPWTLCKSF